MPDSQKARALTKAAPDLAICRIDLEDGIQIFHSFAEVFAGSQDQAYGIHGLDRVRVRAQSMFVGEHGFVKVAQQLRKAP